MSFDTATRFIVPDPKSAGESDDEDAPQSAQKPTGSNSHVLSDDDSSISDGQSILAKSYKDSSHLSDLPGSSGDEGNDSRFSEHLAEEIMAVAPDSEYEEAQERRKGRGKHARPPKDWTQVQIWKCNDTPKKEIMEQLKVLVHQLYDEAGTCTPYGKCLFISFDMLRDPEHDLRAQSNTAANIARNI